MLCRLVMCSSIKYFLVARRVYLQILHCNKSPCSAWKLVLFVSRRDSFLLIRCANPDFKILFRFQIYLTCIFKNGRQCRRSEVHGDTVNGKGNKPTTSWPSVHHNLNIQLDLSARCLLFLFNSILRKKTHMLRKSYRCHIGMGGGGVLKYI